MNLDCARCGAHLKLAPDSDVAECPYCGATRLIERARDDDDADVVVRPSGENSEAQPGSLGRVLGMTLGVVLAGLAVAGVGVYFSVRAVDEERGGAPRPTSAAPPAAEATAPAELEQPPAPVVSRAQASKMLEPEILACMKTHQVHYLIVRIGQGYDPPRGLYPPLVVPYDDATVDYRDVEKFSATPLGQCVLAAAGKVWTDAPRGAYMYFGLRNRDARDPLAGKPRNINQAAAQKALTALDDAARECGRRQLQGFKPGRDLSIIVKYRGIDGQVTSVEPYYIDQNSPYDQCIRAAYQAATVPQFRELSGQVLHKLKF